MKRITIPSLLILLAATAPGFSPLPDPRPVFLPEKIDEVRPELQEVPFQSRGKTENAVEFRTSNKSVAIRKNVWRYDPHAPITIFINGKDSGQFRFFGNNQNGWGTPFKLPDGKKESLVIKKEEGCVIYHRPYLSRKGIPAEFSYTMRCQKDGKIRIFWNSGSSDKVKLTFYNCGEYRGKKLTFGGKEFPQATRKTLFEKKNQAYGSSGKFVFDASNPAERFSVAFSGKNGTAKESFAITKTGMDRFYFNCDFTPAASGEIVIDLEKSPIAAKDRPPAVNGIDFWHHDATHVPLRPTRNLMPNPGFEQGLRYWTWNPYGNYVPGKYPRFEIVSGGVSGKALLIRGRDCSKGSGIRSFPIALKENTKYTLSFYAKSMDGNRGVSLALGSAAYQSNRYKGPYGGVFGDSNSPECKFPVTKEWKRYSRTFTGYSDGLILFLGGDNLILDCFQLEEGSVATGYVSPPVEGLLTTSDPDNDLKPGENPDTAFFLTGKPGLKGRMKITVSNLFREVLYSGEKNLELGNDGTRRIPFPLKTGALGTGIFLVRADYRIPEYPVYTDYYRFSIMRPLENRHATKNIFGNILHFARFPSGEHFARKLMEWGWGSTSWLAFHEMRNPVNAELFLKYRFTNMQSSVEGEVLKKIYPQKKNGWLTHLELLNSKTVSPELEQKVEKETFRLLKLLPPDHNFLRYVGWGNEEESHRLPAAADGNEYFKLQSAVARGARRARPGIGIVPTSGTSGYSKLRGYDAYERYLKTAKRHGFKYEAASVHLYGTNDKGLLSSFDLEECIELLSSQLKRYGFGKECHILSTEGFGNTDFSIPQWSAVGNPWHTFCGKPTYDFGKSEYLQAVTAARHYLGVMRFWPRMESSNIWVPRMFLDTNYTPLLICKAVNTLGNLLPWTEFHSDIKPFPGIRGYAFKLQDGSGIAALWNMNHDMESGLKANTVLRVKFEQPVEFIDFMGNRRSAKMTPDGISEIPVTPAPLFVKAKNVAQLARNLSHAFSDDTRSALQVSIQPQPDGKIAVLMKNLTGHKQSGRIAIDGSEYAFNLNGSSEQVLKLPMKKENSAGKMYHFNTGFKLIYSAGHALPLEWNMDYFFIPHTSGMPDWNKIPAIPIRNRLRAKDIKADAGHPGDFEAQYKMAWDSDNLYLRVDVTDDQFLRFPEYWKRPFIEKYPYIFDGALEVYFDCGANGRTNFSKNFDSDDYRYDFSVGPSNGSGPGLVYRLREVTEQLADGINMASKAEAAKKIKCDFLLTKNGYRYTIVFPQRYIEPIVLRKGFLAGCALFLHDRDRDKNGNVVYSGLSTSCEPGSHCDGRPDLWPLMILAE